jgi:deoxyribonuclease V
MKLSFAINHPWPTDVTEATALQKTLREKLRIKDDFKQLNTVAGIDVSYDIQSNISHSVVVLMKLNQLQPIKIVRAQAPTTFPYIPGFLSFREIPVILEALKMLDDLPDLFMVDGQGIAHPRRLGIAAHLGVLLDMPSIGVAKSLLTGRYKEPGLKKGSQSPLLDKQSEKIGTVLRTKEKTKPLFISPGHCVSHDTVVDLVQQCLIKHRLPEPTRIADKVSKDKSNPNSLFSV